MGLTNFPHGVTSFGVPLIGSMGIPPFSGNYWFVDETNGADGNSGTSWDAPLASLARAQVLATAGNDDVVFFRGTIHQTSSLAWAKDKTHLIGVCAPLKRGKRARISVSGTTAFDKLVNVTGQGCYFANFGTFYGFNSATALICWYDAGGRNCYDNVEFLGFGDGTVSTGTANQTGARALTLTGATGESTFRNCVFGVDTVVRNAANATVEIAGASPRNYFIGCDFEADLGSSGAGAVHLLIGASGIDRYAEFADCKFMNSTKSGATAMTQVANLNASIGGLLLVKDTVWMGATHFETTTTNQAFFNSAAVTTTDPGLSKNNA